MFLVAYSITSDCSSECFVGYNLDSATVCWEVGQQLLPDDPSYCMTARTEISASLDMSASTVHCALTCTLKPIPHNTLLLLFCCCQVGELSEIFQWRGEVPVGLTTFTPADKQHVAEELSDVLLYLVRLADRCHIDLGRAVLDKVAKNVAK